MHERGLSPSPAAGAGCDPAAARLHRGLRRCLYRARAVRIIRGAGHRQLPRSHFLSFPAVFGDCRLILEALMLSLILAPSCFREFPDVFWPPAYRMLAYGGMLTDGGQESDGGLRARGSRRAWERT